MSPELGDQHEREREHRERERIAGQLAREASFVPRARELRQNRDADRLRGDRDDDEEPVGGEQPVGLLAAAELAGDDDADDSGDSRDDQERCRREYALPSEPTPSESVRLLTDAEAYGPCRTTPSGQTARSTDLRREFGDIYDGRTVLVTGADGFMGSHLTDALVELGATVHAFVRATSSGALNNIGHLRNRLKVHFADLTDSTSVDYLVRELKETAPDKPYVFHLGAQAHVGESWHRPYETVMANTIGTLNLLQSVVDWGLELEKFDTAGTSEEYGNVRERSPSTTTSTTPAASSCTSARRSTRSRSTRPRRSRPTS